MTTGRIDYAPDYKSEKRNPLNLIFEEGMQRQRVSAERTRLERAVVDAVKRCRAQPGSSWDWLQPSDAYGPEVCKAWAQLETAIDDLLELEAQQDQK